MIVVERLALDQRQATVRVLAADAAEQRAAGARLRPLLQALGCDSIRWILPGGRQRTLTLDGHPSVGVACRRDTSSGAPVVALVPVALTHRCSVEDGIPLYVGRVAHRRESLGVMSVYCDLLLSTLAPRVPPLSALRLALYEICANVIEHGRPLVEGAVLEVGLRCETQAVSGWIADCCERFDPLARPAVPLPDLARQGHRRGYGLAIIRSTLDSASHRYDASGNRLEFRKELTA